jgi:hypothetical protein
VVAYLINDEAINNSDDSGNSSMNTSKDYSNYFRDIFKHKLKKQAGAELCQAQEKLVLAKPALPCKQRWLTLQKTLRSSFIIKKLWSSSICQQIEVIFCLT